ncbi:hypothetical protein FAM09_14755 [Niastella caeni]|uniref:SH3 domain-containing protein n=1 Tax=Niastella caeni TaxID=2569763 RepID=A0A4S8HVV3_9BACT|nr:hypothetical protein [Niastella caeni]THU39750.1 hypothetical protein FAM09_14755 [Niastella caeni]
MKILSILSSFLLCIVISSYAQFNDKYDTVDCLKVRINQLPLGEKKSTIIKAFGKPAKITKVESIDEEWYDYHYKGSIIQVSPDGYLHGFEISDADFVLTYRSTKIKIGDSVSVLKKLFPKSYKEFNVKKSKYLRTRFGDTDEYLLFGIRNNRIVHFKNWFDNT